jgi:hypothetical protein
VSNLLQYSRDADFFRARWSWSSLLLFLWEMDAARTLHSYYTGAEDYERIRNIRI